MRRAIADLLAVAGMTAGVFAVAARMELHEAFSRWVSAYERWQIDELPVTLCALAAGLGWFAFRRWRDTRREIAQRLAAEQRITELAADNRKLAQQLILAQESERRALARELHDELAQLCNAIHVESAYIANLGEHQRAAMVAGAERIGAAVQELYQLVRDMLRRLRPGALDQLGLVGALEELCESWSARTGITCTFFAQRVPDALDDAVAVALYRVSQEALANVARHSGAARVDIQLRGESEDAPRSAPGRLVLTIEDDGRGMDERAPRAGLGLLGMQERVAALGGAFALRAAPGRGLRLQMAVPAG